MRLVGAGELEAWAPSVLNSHLKDCIKDMKAYKTTLRKTLTSYDSGTKISENQTQSLILYVAGL